MSGRGLSCPFLGGHGPGLREQRPELLPPPAPEDRDSPPPRQAPLPLHGCPGHPLLPGRRAGPRVPVARTRGSGAPGLHVLLSAWSRLRLHRPCACGPAAGRDLLHAPGCSLSTWSRGPGRARLRTRGRSPISRRPADPRRRPPPPRPHRTPGTSAACGRLGCSQTQVRTLGLGSRGLAAGLRSLGARPGAGPGGDSRGGGGRTDVGGQLPGGVRAERGDLQDHVAVGLHGGPGDRAQPAVGHVVQLRQLVACKGKKVTKERRTCSGQARRRRRLGARWGWPAAGAIHAAGPGRRRSDGRPGRQNSPTQAGVPEAGRAVQPRCGTPAGGAAGEQEPHAASPAGKAQTHGPGQDSGGTPAQARAQGRPPSTGLGGT